MKSVLTLRIILTITGGVGNVITNLADAIVECIKKTIIDTKGDLLTMFNGFKKHITWLLPLFYVIALFIGIQQEKEIQKIAELDSLEQFQVINIIDEHSLVVENLEDGSKLTVDFNDDFSVDSDLIGSGIQFEKFKVIGEGHIKAIDCIWG